MNFPMISFATRCRLHVDSRANRCDQKLNLPIPVSKVSCHLANKMSAKVWHTSWLDQYGTTCCGHVWAMKIQHCYRGVDSVDSRWTRGGLSSDSPLNSGTICQFMIEELFFLLRWTRGGLGFDPFPPQQSLTVDPPHSLGFYNIKSESTGSTRAQHCTGDPSSKRGVHAKSLVSKTARTFGTPQGHFLSLPQPLS